MEEQSELSQSLQALAVTSVTSLEQCTLASTCGFNERVKKGYGEKGNNVK